MRLGALAVILACIATRVCVSFEPVPYWDGDPTVLAGASSALGPTFSIAIDLVMLLAAVVGLVSVEKSARPTIFEALVVLAPAVAIWKHFGSSVEDVRLGSAWLAAMVGALAIKSLCVNVRLRRVAMALLVALPLILAAKGASQVFVEHAQTVRAYGENKEQFLAAQGWTVDSPSARAFERRLLQPEATGWFGLSNVYATIAAFGAVAWVGLSFAPTANRRGLWAAVPLCGAVCMGSLWLSESKGGVGSALIGLGLLGIGAIVRSRRRGTEWLGRFGGLIGIGIVAVVIAGVAARGMLGERLGELSLLFRWFYMQGAARIFSEHSLWGVGPAGFKDAYMIAKPALSPEEVTSPHSVMFDFSATLGVFGMAWCGWWLCLAAKCGQGLFAPQSHGPASDTEDPWAGIERRVLFLVCAAGTMVGAYAERDAATPEAAAFRIGGMLVGTLGAVVARDAIARVPSCAWVFAAGALGVAAHVQIEVTAIWLNACAWAAAVLACGASTASRVRTDATVPRMGSLAAIGAAVVFALIAARLPAICGWEKELRQAAAEVRVPVELRARLEALASGRKQRDSIRELADELSRLEGRLIGDTLPAMRTAIEDLQEAASVRALERLNAGAERYPDAGQTLRAAARLSMQLASARRGRGDQAAAVDDAARAEAFSRRACDLVRSRGASYSWLGTLLVAQADVLGDLGALPRAAAAWEAAAVLDPFGINSPVKLAEVYVRLGDRGKAAQWAKRALERDQELRLDPLVGLSAAQRAELMKVAGGS